MVMKWFRRNQKLMMAILVGVLMVAWGALPALNWLARRGAAKRGEIYGRRVGEEDLRNAAIQLETSVRYGLLHKGTLMGQFIFADQDEAGPPRATSDALWRYLILVHEADEAGVRVTTEELQNVLALTRLPADDSALCTALRNLLRILKLLSYREECAQLSESELWMEYNYLERAVKIRLVELGPELFLSQVDATPEEVKAFYEEHQGVQPDPRTGRVGYRAPERVRLEYALAPVEDFEEQVTVSDDEIKAYYEDHQDEFKPPETKEGSPEDEQKPAGEGAASSNEEGEGSASEAELVAGEPEAGGETAATTQQGTEQQAQPLSAEVQDKIRKELVEEKAREAARQQVERVLDDLEEVAASYVNQPWPLEQMARRHDLRYEMVRTEAGELLLSRADVQLKVPGGAQVARRVFEENLDLHVPSFLDTPVGPLVIQLLERREPQARPFEEVADQVRRDLLRVKGLAKAKTVAEKLKESAAASSLEQAVREMNERLEKLVGSSGQPGSGAAEGAEAGGEAQSGGDGLLKVEQTDFIPRYSTYVSVLRKSRPAVMREAFRLAPEGLAVVEETGPDPACYVVQKMGEKPADPGLFYGRADMQRAFAAYRKRRLAVEGWLEGLVAKIPAPARKEK